MKPRPPLADEWLAAVVSKGGLAEMCVGVGLISHAKERGHWRWMYCGMRPGYRDMVNMECRRCGARFSVKSQLLDMELA